MMNEKGRQKAKSNEAKESVLAREKKDEPPNDENERNDGKVWRKKETKNKAGKCGKETRARAPALCNDCTA